MERMPSGEPRWELNFDERGGMSTPDRDRFLDEVAAENPATLFFFSHGWGTAHDAAKSLYDAMFPMLRDAAVAAGLPKPGFAGIFWPSLWFPPTPAVAPAMAGVAKPQSRTAEVSGADIAASLAPGFSDPDQQKALAELGELLDAPGDPAVSTETEAERERVVGRIQELISSIAAPAGDAEPEDSGELSLLLNENPKDAFQRTAKVFGSEGAGAGAQGIGDWFGRAVNGAKDAVRVLSYNVMKTRAGDIGRTGLGPLLADLHTRAPAVRAQLLGHSFGARLVSFALAGVGAPDRSPVTSLLLIQGAFSHLSFAPAQGNPFGRPGALNGFGDRVHGPLLATFSPFDWAVGVWYPRASFLTGAGPEAEADGRWDAMGKDGYQHVDPAADIRIPLGAFDFRPGTYYRVDAGDVINNVKDSSFGGAHSDIRKPEVAALAAAAARPV
ncbi:hypothetical protein FPZ12_027070 [Amycolatopsis acidicola]|uniref:Serine-threonine protein kinase n=1 Tax=Amycolatopsis acidicola TaxID=2596893 RepID=A0A5N0UYY3_9PSEU|nr:hypothetical protein [Amycolatopsis acidicola]KAA9156699.1 hypothetical protein FPZ12_027070 [Amycolatopsis acidicola]